MKPVQIILHPMQAIRRFFDPSRPSSIKSYYKFAGFLAVMGALGITASVHDDLQRQEKMRAKEEAVRSETTAARKLNRFNGIDSAGVEAVCGQAEKAMLQAKTAGASPKPALELAKTAHKKAYQEANLTFLRHMRACSNNAQKKQACAQNRLTGAQNSRARACIKF